MKGSSRHILFISIILSIVLGLILGFFMRGRLVDTRIKRKHFELSDLKEQIDSLYDFNTGKTVRLYDTLSQKERNLLVFWSPTCGFSKDFFLHQLNDKAVGIYCFPMTDDYDYLKYYIDKKSIQYSQLMLESSHVIKPIEVSSIVATPTFVVVDDTGQNLTQYIGINEIDEMIAFLYQGIL